MLKYYVYISDLNYLNTYKCMANRELQLFVFNSLDVNTNLENFKTW